MCGECFAITRAPARLLQCHLRRLQERVGQVFYTLCPHSSRSGSAVPWNGYGSTEYVRVRTCVPTVSSWHSYSVSVGNFFWGEDSWKKLQKWCKRSSVRTWLSTFSILLVLLNEREQICATWLPDTYSISGQFHRLPKYS